PRAGLHTPDSAPPPPSPLKRVGGGAVEQGPPKGGGEASRGGAPRWGGKWSTRRTNRCRRSPWRTRHLCTPHRSTITTIGNQSMTTHELQRFGSVSPGEALPLLILPGPVAFESVRKAQKGGGTHPFETMAVALWWGSIYCGGQHNQCVACDHEVFLPNTDIGVAARMAVLRGGGYCFGCT